MGQQGGGAAMSAIFLKFWRGQYSLGRTFWVGLALGFFFVNFATNGLYRVFFEQGYGTRGFLIGLMIKWSYVAIAMIAVWRAAQPKVSSPVWIDKLVGWGARLIILSLAAKIGMFLFNDGAINIVRNVSADVPGQVQLLDEDYAKTERKTATAQPTR
jgi:hypothetical protein